MKALRRRIESLEAEVHPGAGKLIQAAVGFTGRDRYAHLKGRMVSE